MKEYLNLQKLFPEKMIDLTVFHEITITEMDFSLLEIITKWTYKAMGKQAYYVLFQIKNAIALLTQQIITHTVHKHNAILKSITYHTVKTA